jgi:hypothetical protein
MAIRVPGDTTEKDIATLERGGWQEVDRAEALQIAGAFDSLANPRFSVKTLFEVNLLYEERLALRFLRYEIMQRGSL